ncbi:MAG: hypothetical protein HY711_09045, partial [Candidatus Melainabacteria bacterium]|nr:hypothetical protein [Candidatus Melainabacteria bacterium]
MPSRYTTGNPVPNARQRIFMTAVVVTVLFFTSVQWVLAEDWTAKKFSEEGTILLAQGSKGSKGGKTGTGAQAVGNAKDVNEVTSFDVRKNYFKRFPYAKSAFDHDVTKVKTSKTAKGTKTRVTTQGKGPVNIRESVGPGLGIVLAYDICHVHCTGIGHWLPLAELHHQPQIPCPIPACYTQPKLYATDKPKTKRDEELFSTALSGVNGLPLSDTQFQILDRENKQRFLELLFDPERFMWLAVNTGQMQGASAANSFAGAGESTFMNSVNWLVGEGADVGSKGGGTKSSSSGGGGNPLSSFFGGTSLSGLTGLLSGGSGAFGPSGGGGAAAGSAALINVANENAAIPTSAHNRQKLARQAVWMVQQMYKLVFLPMAILFLLPGAVLTHVKSFVSRGILGSHEDAGTPFEGILRAIIAIFLIPATQLIISYAIDVGNSMAESVKPWVSPGVISAYMSEQMYNPPPGNEVNAVLPPGGGQTTTEGKPLGASGDVVGGSIPGGGNQSSSSGSGGGGLTQFTQAANIMAGGGSGWNKFLNLLKLFMGGSSSPDQQAEVAAGQGKAAEQQEDKVVPEKQRWLSQIMQLFFNVLNYFMSVMLIALCAYQLVFMCYLLLLGPIAASFFAWPDKVGKLFRPVFANWLNAVITLSLWRFYWVVI